MKLYFKKIGEGKPLFILHGLFGLGDNWATISKSYAENGFCCYLIDLRNHGRSPHSFDITYEAMATDLAELMQDEQIEKINLIGHSMGGKAAMFFSSLYTEKTNKLIVADIAPRYYAQHHQSIFSTLKSIDISTLTTRKETEELVRSGIKDEATIQLLMKNLYWKDDTTLDWRFGFSEIEQNIENIGKEFAPGKKINIPVLFVKGERSGYINESDETEIKKIFPLAEFKVVPSAGHWVHAENPKGFLEATLEFLKIQLH
jgi:esterase